MSIARRTRALAPVVALLLAAGLTACGEEDESAAPETSSQAPTGGGLGQVTVTGDFGAEPKLEWQGPVSVQGIEAETLVEGDGEEVGDGDLVRARILLANGAEEEVLSGDFSAPQVFVLSDQLIPALRDQVSGAAAGSRILVAAPPKDAFGEQGNPQLGLGAEDSVVLVVDVVGTGATEPSGTEVDPAPWMPELQETDGKPSGMDFAGTPKPGSALRKGLLIRGDGPMTEAGDQLYVNYLGQVYGGEQPFDESYSRGPFDFTLGQGAVVSGWDQALVGVPVGSRVLIAVPPALGYGKQGQGDIKGTDTMYFVIDVLMTG